MPHAQYDHKADRNRLAIICDAIFWPVWTQPKKTGVWIAIQIAIFFVVETALVSILFPPPHVIIQCLLNATHLPLNQEI